MTPPNIVIQMGPVEGSKQFNLEIKSNMPLNMEEVALLLFQAFEKHCQQIKIDREDIIELSDKLIREPLTEEDKILN